MDPLLRTIVRKTLRVPGSTAPGGDGAAVARQLDAVLAGVGFVADRELLEHVSGRAPGAATDLAVEVVGAVRELVGDHVEHNSYFPSPSSHQAHRASMVTPPL
ncbi:hypothetical protein [Pseudonocardia zijingensis]|uniref:Uncharacterized protein n=1 Tax=Pseudonocardia zijingensis TaxID=153376 RepID=A0ABN1NAS2_9PSEU